MAWPFVGIQEHFKCHPYAPELSELVRRGLLTRQEGLAMLDDAPDAKQVSWMAEELGIPVPGGDNNKT